jgi:hypothetical protein
MTWGIFDICCGHGFPLGFYPLLVNEGQRDGTSFMYKCCLIAPAFSVCDHGCKGSEHRRNRFPRFFFDYLGRLDSWHGHGHSCALCQRRGDSVALDAMNTSVIEQQHADLQFMFQNFATMSPDHTFFLTQYCLFQRQLQLERKWKKGGVLNDKGEDKRPQARRTPVGLASQRGAVNTVVN